jgi:hypothetical protein
MSTLVANGVGNVKCEIIAAFVCGDFYQLFVLFFAEMFLKIQV